MRKNGIYCTEKEINTFCNPCEILELHVILELLLIIKMKKQIN